MDPKKRCQKIGLKHGNTLNLFASVSGVFTMESFKNMAAFWKLQIAAL
jgi:hypothetical protein